MFKCEKCGNKSDTVLFRRIHYREATYLNGLFFYSPKEFPYKEEYACTQCGNTLDTRSESEILIEAREDKLKWKELAKP